MLPLDTSETELLLLDALLSVSAAPGDMSHCARSFSGSSSRLVYLKSARFLPSPQNTDCDDELDHTEFQQMPADILQLCRLDDMAAGYGIRVGVKRNRFAEVAARYLEPDNVGTLIGVAQVKYRNLRIDPHQINDIWIDPHSPYSAPEQILLSVDSTPLPCAQHVYLTVRRLSGHFAPDPIWNDDCLMNVIELDFRQDDSL